MTYVYYILGFSLTLFIIIDLVWTTLWVDGGAGPLSDTLTTIAWKIIKKINNTFLLNIAGALILLLILLSWFFLIWVGVTIFFAGDPGSIINTNTNEAISWYQLFYFTGYTLFTSGIGDYIPQSGFFQIVTALVSGIGMMLLTLGASYVISVVGAVVEKRAFSRSVSGLGENSQELLKNTWNGQNFFQFDLILVELNSQITKLTQQNQAFPLLQFYHSESPEKTASINIAVLDDALTLIDIGLIDKSLVNTTLLKATQASISTYLETIIDVYGNQVNEVTTVPSEMNLSLLKETTIPLVTQKEYSKKLDKLSDRRNQLLKIIKADSHDWPNE